MKLAKLFRVLIIIKTHTTLKMYELKIKIHVYSIIIIQITTGSKNSVQNEP